MKRPFDYGISPPGWRPTQLRSFLTRYKHIGRVDLPLLSVNLPNGVVMRQEGDGRPAPADDLSTYQHVRVGDLVMNQLGKPHGALGVAAYEGIISPAYFVAEVGPSAEPRFVHYLLRTRLYISEFERRGKFMPPSQFDIGWDQFRAIEAVMPPLVTQRTIADFLDSETTRIDALITKKRHMIELLDERFEVTVFESVTTGIRGRREMVPCRLAWLTELPRAWGLPTVSTNFALQLGKMLNSESSSGPDQYPYLRNVNVQWDHVSCDDLATMHFDAVDRARCDLRSGDVLVCEGGEVGRAAIWNDEMEQCYFQKAIHRLRPRISGDGRFLMYALRAAAKQNVFVVEGNLSTIVHLTSEQLRAHRFPWPPKAERVEIVSYLDIATARWRKFRRFEERQIVLLIERRQALITAAVTGELEIPGVAA